MRTAVKKTKVYKFSELSAEGQKAALNNMWDINVDREWWDSMYEDAANVGIKITEFDIDRASYCRGNFNLSAHEVAANIIRDHGQDCNTYKTAQKFLDEINSFEQTDDNEPGEGEQYESKMIELEEEFTQSIFEDYLSLLRQEYEYLTSEEAIKETIEANDYEFTADGKQYY